MGGYSARQVRYLLRQRIHVHLSLMKPGNSPFPINDKRPWQADDAIGARDAPPLVDPIRVSDSEFLNKSLCVVPFVKAHAQKDDSFVLVQCPDLLQFGGLLAARETPTGPKIEHHHLSAQIAQRDL